MSTETEQKILDALNILQQKVDKLEVEIQKSNDRLETYPKASDNLIRLVTTIVTAASAIVILTPLAKVVADFSAKSLGVG